MNGPTKDRQGVEQLEIRIDQVGLVPFPTDLVLFGASVMVDREEQPSGIPRS